MLRLTDGVIGRRITLASCRRFDPSFFDSVGEGWELPAPPQSSSRWGYAGDFSCSPAHRADVLGFSRTFLDREYPAVLSAIRVVEGVTSHERPPHADRVTR